MALGKSHDSFNMSTGPIVYLFLSFYFPYQEFLLMIFLGHLIATFFINPDLDLCARKSLGPLKFYFIPYAKIFKHRGLSHNFFLGTLSRYLYIILPFLFFDLSLNYFFQKKFLFFLFGMYMADWSHYFLDWFSSLKK